MEGSFKKLDADGIFFNPAFFVVGKLDLIPVVFSFCNGRDRALMELEEGDAVGAGRRLHVNHIGQDHAGLLVLASIMFDAKRDCGGQQQAQRGVAREAPESGFEE